MNSSKRSLVFYGWYVVAAAFVITFVGFGSAYTFSAFLDSLQHEFGASRGSVSAVFSMAGFLYFSFGIVSAPLAGRLGVKTLCAIGMACAGGGLILAAQAQTLIQVYVAYGIGIGIGVGCAYVPALGAVQRWFIARRGLASGLAVSGIGVGTFVMPPLATWLIGGFGWRNAYSVIGALTIILGIAAAFGIEDEPIRRGQYPDGVDGSATANTAVSQSPTDTSVRDAVRTRRFLDLYLASLMASLGVFVPFVHLAPFARDHGMMATTATWLVGAIGIGSTLGRFFLGSLADRMGRERFLIGMYTGMAVALVVWLLGASFPLLLVFAIVFGLFYGGWVAVLPAVVADMFGARHAGRIIGVLYTSVAIGTLVGPSTAGFVYDISQSYTIPIAVGAATNALAALMTLLAVRRAEAAKGPTSFAA